ncbi:hypothetical protein TrRE_jg7699 [Triparma retinervis]|uniref:Uncharacterized protein n=1 Tax=Triparma retinervis TaxID=2557542 RepID=A0A9W7FWY3_9STRA|nr:hypothetical protein TrRE_jg7699 [Triparma retinervis]
MNGMESSGPMTSCSFGDQANFARNLATQTVKARNEINSHRMRVFDMAQKKKIEPTFQELYPSGKMQLTFHHGRKYDQDDLRAQDCRKEAERGEILKKEAEERDMYEREFKGKGNEESFMDVGTGFVNHFPKPPGREELDRRVARDQAGLWSLDKNKGLTRVEKVIAKKWGVDCDAEYWADGERKEGFKVTFFHGRRYDREDFQQMDAKAVGDLGRELEREEKIQRKKYAGGMFPQEIEQKKKEKLWKSMPGFKRNFQKLENKQQIATGTIIKLLDALPDEELKPKTKWVTPAPSDFECVPNRPGVAKWLHSQKDSISRTQQMYFRRKEHERLAKAWAGEEEVFAEREEGAGKGKEREAEEGERSVMSAQTSVTVMRSEVSIGTPMRGERGE